MRNGLLDLKGEVLDILSARKLEFCDRNLTVSSHPGGRTNLFGNSIYVVRTTAMQFYILRNQSATAFGQNRTAEPILKLGMRPAFASLYRVMADTPSSLLSSRALTARPRRSI